MTARNTRAWEHNLALIRQDILEGWLWWAYFAHSRSLGKGVFRSFQVAQTAQMRIIGRPRR